MALDDAGETPTLGIGIAEKIGDGVGLTGRVVGEANAGEIGHAVIADTVVVVAVVGDDRRC